MTWKMLEKVNVLLKGIRGNIKLTEEKVLSVTLLLEQFCILKIDKDTLINWWKQKGFKCYWIKKQIEPFHIKKFKLIIKVMQLILIMLIGIDVCDRMVFLWEETGVPRWDPPVWLGDNMTISHADAWYQIRVAALRGECVNTAPARHLDINKTIITF